MITVLSSIFIILGIGYIAWGVFTVWAHPDYSITNTIDIEPSIIEGDITDNGFEDNIVKTDTAIYSVYPAEGDSFGSLIIPMLDLELPIIQGTSDKELDKGVGHFLQSVLPGENDNSVLSGHRETYFKDLGNLEIGDLLIAQTSAGIFTYEVSGTRIVSEDDRTVIVPTDHAVLTLTTCYPFDFIGSAPERYIVSADLVSSDLTLN